MSICCKTSLFFDAFRLTVVDLLNFFRQGEKNIFGYKQVLQVLFAECCSLVQFLKNLFLKFFF